MKQMLKPVVYRGQAPTNRPLNVLFTGPETIGSDLVGAFFLSIGSDFVLFEK